MKKIFLPLLLIIFFTSGCSVMNYNYEKIVIGIDDNFAPMGFRDENGELIGFDIDLAKEAIKRMNCEVEFKPIDWANKEEAITSGSVDMIWNGLDIMDEYKEYMIFSKPYMDNRQILLVQKGNPQNIYSEFDLRGKIVATQAGSHSEIYINANESVKNSFKEFRTYPNFKDGFAALAKGEFDALIIDEIAARYEMTINPGAFDIVETTIGSITKFGIGFPKDKVELRDKVQKVFDGMIKDGTAKEISEKWFHADLIKTQK